MGQCVAVAMLVSVLAAACMQVRTSRETHTPKPVAAQLSGEPHDARFAATATLLPTGKALIAGGVAKDSTAASEAELYDPTAGGFVPTGRMLSGRAYHTATLLSDGRVLFAGGVGPNGAPVREAELYDPPSGRFEPGGKMLDARFNHTATLLPNGKVLITGGELTTNAIHPVSTVELYDPATGTFSPTGNDITRFYDPEIDKFYYRGRMGTVRTKHTATLLANGQVLIVGGSNADAKSLASAELYNPLDGKFTPTGSMVYPRREHRATRLADGCVLVTGGVDSSDRILSIAEIYDPASGKFSLTTTAFPGTSTNMMDQRYEHTATLLGDGRVLVAGGADAHSILTTAELYNPSRGSFSCIGGHLGGSNGSCNRSMQDARSYAAAVALVDGRVLIVGGYNFRASIARTPTGPSAVPFSLVFSAEVYNPANGTFTSTMTLLHAWREGAAVPHPAFDALSLRQ
jgi:hypothetical protein